MKTNRLMSAALVVAFFVGCAKEYEKYAPEYSDYTELFPRSTDLKQVDSKVIAELQPDDVIVAVNGYPLTKGEMSRQLAVMAKVMMDKRDHDEYTAGELLKQEEQMLVPNFVRLRLLVDEARRQKVLTTNQVFDAVNEKISIGARDKKKTVKQFIASFPCEIKYVLCDLAEKQWVNALIEKSIPPKAKVDEAFVKAVQDQVSADNDAAKATNELYKAMLAGWKKEAESGVKTFAQLAKEHSQDFNPDKEDGSYWGEWERGQMDSMKVQAAAFALKLGEITDPVEDENGIHIVKVLKIVPAVKNDKGRVIQHEIRTLAHIYLEKEPMILRQNDQSMFRDVKRQMQLQAIDEYVDVLKTNGLHKVVYPHGEKLFKIGK